MSTIPSKLLVTLSCVSAALLACAACGSSAGSPADLTPDASGAEASPPTDASTSDRATPGDASVSCAKDTQSDPDNCGACGHSCFGGACKAGQCQAIELAAVTSEIDQIAFDGDDIYFNDFNAKTVSRCHLPGCTGGPSTLVTGSTGRNTQFVTGLAVDGTHLYWTEWSNSVGHVLKCTLPACKDEPVDMVAYGTADGESISRPISVVIDSANAYWLDNRVCSCSLGCAGAALDQLTPYQASNGLPTGLVRQDSRLYWLTADASPSNGSGSIQSCALPGCAGGPQVVAAGLVNPNGLTVTADAVYWTSATYPDDGEGKVLRCGLPDCPGGPTIVQSHVQRPISTAVAKNLLLWGASDGVYACELPGCSTATMLARTPSNGPNTSLTNTLTTDGRVLAWYSAGPTGDGGFHGDLSMIALP